MSNSKLSIFKDRYVYHVSWIDDDGEEGAWIGQDAALSVHALKAQAQKAKLKRSDDGWSEFEYTAVELAAKEWAKRNPGIAFERPAAGYEFESHADAKRFLADMRSAAKAARSEYDTGVPWPEWAKQAQAAGWKPPKNWKP